MTLLHHTLRRQTLDLEVSSQALAFALQPRLGDFNRRRLLPVIERVFDELDVPGRQVWIRKLEIDLGTVPISGFEETVVERLEVELRGAVKAALREVGETATAAGHSRSEEAARRELLEHYLVRGTLPFWAPKRSAFSLEALVLEMAVGDPAGIVAVVRRLGRETRVLERLVLQLREPGLRELIRLLAREHATLIIAYIGHIREAHRGEPLVPLSEEALTRILWLLAQVYLVRDPGSQFNRRSFVRSVLRGIAAREGLEYADVLAALRQGLERTASRRSIRSSLPGVVGELARDLGLATLAAPADAGEFLAAFRRGPKRRPELVRDAPAALFDTVLDCLCPAQAGTLKALLRLFARIPAPYRPRPEERVRRALLDVALSVRKGARLKEDSYHGLLRELFPSPLPEVVERFLLREAVDGPAGDERFLSAVRAAGARGGRDETASAADYLARHAADRRLRQQWVKRLPEPALARVVQRLAPRRHRALLDAAEVLAAAWGDTAPPGHPAFTGRRAFWSFLLEHLARHPGKQASVERLVTEFFAHVARRYRGTAAARSRAGARLLKSAGRRARSGGHAHLAATLQHGRPRLLAFWEAPPSKRRERRPPVRRESLREQGEPLYVDNAGLVLAGAFLPHLFKTLELLGEDADGKVRLRDAEAASRAVHLLQYLVDGGIVSPEPGLAVNKILCGVPLEAPIELGITPTDRELEVCDTLLRSMLANWKALASTSVAGLRETFLQREGRLERSSGEWKLRVQRKTVDVLVDEVPWSLSVIFHRWMPQPLQVTW
jgi:hypothetical protein